MASYQEIDTRLRVIEDKVAFVMRNLVRPVPSALPGAPPRVMTMEQLYEELRQVELAKAPIPSKVRESIRVEEVATEAARG
jgi:hypothetical protein